jgi:acetyltransferase-like isoleucine patch superfamily enzyme
VKLKVLLRRFAVPRLFVTVYHLAKHRAFISPQAEVELSPMFIIGPKSAVSSFTKIKVGGPVRIGARTDIGTGCFIAGSHAGIEIGDDCLISPNVSIVGVNYRYDRIDQTIREQGTVTKGPTRIGNNVWLGAGAVVLDGAEIGDGVIVTPNSVVSGKIPPNTIVQGNPGKAIFTRR